MKEATGELNMTVVTLIAIAAIAALFYFAIWPMVQRMLVQQTCNTYGTDYTAQKDTVNTNGTNTGSNAKVNVWCCCKGAAAGTGGTGATTGCAQTGCIMVN
jgi:hypothetical protein